MNLMNKWLLVGVQLPAASMTYRSPNSTLDITIKGKKAHFYAEMK